MRNPIKQLLAVAVVVGTTSAASADAPRTLASGRPACGNTMGKGGPSSECEWQAQLWAMRSGLATALHEQRLVKDLAAAPRTNGRPARGNTAGKNNGRCRQKADDAIEAKLVVALQQVEAWRNALASTVQAHARWKASEASALVSSR